MSKVDLFFSKPFKSQEVQWLKLYDKSLTVQENGYSGYVGVSVPRIKLIPLLVRLREAGAIAWSVPVFYRDQPNLSQGSASSIATIYCENHNLKVITDRDISQDQAPLFWKFITVDTSGEKSGGCIMIDRVDGHIWTLDELDTYLYDYNCIF